MECLSCLCLFVFVSQCCVWFKYLGLCFVCFSVFVFYLFCTRMCICFCVSMLCLLQFGTECFIKHCVHHRENQLVGCRLFAAGLFIQTSDVSILCLIPAYSFLVFVNQNPSAVSDFYILFRGVCIWVLCFAGVIIFRWYALFVAGVCGLLQVFVCLWMLLFAVGCYCWMLLFVSVYYRLFALCLF